MPNWNYNVVKVSHTDQALVDKFISGCKTGLFSEFLPIPEDQKENWYEWSVANWGTKWDVNARVEVEDGVVTATFDTAWSPPISFFEHLLSLDFDVTAYYYEPGMAFCGIFDGLGDAYYEIGSLSGDEVQESIPEELNEMFGISQEKWDYEAENEEIELEDAFNEIVNETLSAKETAKQEIRLAINSLEAALIALDNEE
jgi:hypothetical protein